MKIAGLVALLLLGLAPPARAQPVACPSGNILAGRRPSAWQEVRGELGRPTDGEIAPEGAVWDAPLGLRLVGGASTVTWDLGAVVELRAAWVQADANDAYGLWGSVDGRDFRPLGRIEPVDGGGLRGRSLSLGGAPVRYLRFGEGVGDDLYSLAEIAVFCEVPAPFPPAMRVGAAPPAPVAPAFAWNDTTSARWELILALLGLALLRWGWQLRRDGRPDAHARLRDRLLAALGVVAALTYVNFGAFHFSGFIHDHEWTHYYLGAKYSDELGYDRLYECLATADADAGLRRRVELRKIRNLHTNLIERTDDVLAHPERCTNHFTPARWQAFEHDAGFFRARQSPGRWDGIQVDHGYNATPVWNALGHVLTNLGPASDGQLYTLALLDPAYLVGMIAVIWWAFGWRVLSVALLVFATNFPSRFFWTGGSFLRWDWLFFLVASVCCLKKERPALAGAALAYAACLRVFPALVFVGPAIVAAGQLRRGVDPRWRRFFAGAAATVVLLLAVSWPLSGGRRGYAAFVENTTKHEATPMTNNMGLRTVLAWRPSEVGRHLQDGRLVEPWRPWKEARLAASRASRPLFLLLMGVYLWGLARAVRGREPWVVAALAVTAIAAGVELTSYYYAFIIAVALLHAARAEVGRWLLVLTAFTGVMAWAPLRGMSTWYDEQFTAMSAGTLLAFAALLWLFARAPGAGNPGAGRPAALT